MYSLKLICNVSLPVQLKAEPMKDMDVAETYLETYLAHDVASDHFSL